MPSEEKKLAEHLGFLTSFGNQTDGLIGGLLVLNGAGRPVEFHCTSPVRPNRAQEILYGNTLRGFVCGEQIAPALLGRTKVRLLALLTNNPEFLSALHLLPVPMGIVFSHVSVDSSDKERYADWDRKKDCVKNENSSEVLGNEPIKIDSEKSSDDCVGENNKFCLGVQSFFYDSLNSLPLVPGVDYSLLEEICRGKNRLAFQTASKEFVSKLDSFLKFIDSVEPFERIRLAIEEAQRTS